MPASDPRPLTIGRLLWRGITKRCPLCGGGRLFKRWFTMRERCPRCSFPLERIEGHWIGALGMNTIVSFGALFLTIAGTLVASYPDVPTRPLMVASVAVAIVVPLVFFPFSKTLWSAIDLAMRPLEPDDDVDPDWLPPSARQELPPSGRPEP
ncbi:MAG TPA: DUF983 domain-containing protein [Acidimicrobiales bacterium]